LWAKTPCPVQIRAPSVPSRRVRSQPYPRLRLLIRPSLPVRHFTVLRNAGRCSSACLALPGLPLLRDDDVPDAEVVQGVLDALLAVATVGGGGPWLAAGALDDPLDRRRELRRVRRVALLQVVIEHDAVLVVRGCPEFRGTSVAAY